jgi:HPt (histidine-containing phosphotransfer) domain-containing protein
MLIKSHIDLHSCVENLQANVFVADKDFNLVYMNAYARKNLKTIEPTIQKVFRLNVDDIMGGSIHRFHRDPKKVEAILRNPAALAHEADFEFGDVVLRTVINAVWDETGQLEAYVVNWEDITESKKLESALSDKLRELNNANQELLKRNWQIEQDEADLKDAHEVEERAHAIKGASANICAGPVREAALQLERAGRNKDLSQTPQLYKVFKKEFQRLLEYLKFLPLPS